LAAGPAWHVFALWALPSGHWARLASREADVPYSVWTLGSDIWSLGRIPLVRSYLATVLRDAHLCVADGLDLQEETQVICGREVGFLPSTRRIEGRRAAPPRGQAPYRLVFIGRWHPNKGADLLLEALGLLGDEDWQRIERIRIFGGGPLDVVVREKAARLRIAGRPLEVGGYLGKAEAEREIADADYLLIPSRIESIPVVFSDAIKLGCPVVSTPVGDLQRLLSGAHAPGVLAEAVSAPAFATALSRALVEPARAYETAVAHAAREFDLARITDRLLANLGGRG